MAKNGRSYRPVVSSGFVDTTSTSSAKTAAKKWSVVQVEVTRGNVRIGEAVAKLPDETQQEFADRLQVTSDLLGLQIGVASREEARQQADRTAREEANKKAKDRQDDARKNQDPDPDRDGGNDEQD